MDNSNDSFTDPMEREAIETLLSISKAPSPQRTETVMERIPSSTDPCCLPGDPPPMFIPQTQLAVEDKLINYQADQTGRVVDAGRVLSQDVEGHQKSVPGPSKLAQVCQIHGSKHI